MTRLEIITTIGDVLTRLDVLRGSMLPEAPERRPLDDVRTLLDGRQRRLSQEQFDENTASFRDAAANLQQINKELQETIQDLQSLVATIENVKRLIAAMDTLMGVALPFA